MISTSLCSIFGRIQTRFCCWNLHLVASWGTALFLVWSHVLCLLSKFWIWNQSSNLLRICKLESVRCFRVLPAYQPHRYQMYPPSLPPGSLLFGARCGISPEGHVLVLIPRCGPHRGPRSCDPFRFISRAPPVRHDPL